ncbi:hypothetical protein [Paenibacillus gallinarum]|uniref:GerMN domain-containing protein n=1 Tax=Paenibacillus gallinarum TaxID=2762232 RepID=A0ABR8T1D7_9BACL|nr:hypothetical protein [Paenibacillus gallinarum]MBD7969580.1 hypothetical protein [Paenibacillus gallinarum]
MKNVKHFILIASLVLVIQGCSAEKEHEAIQNQHQEVIQTEDNTTNEDAKSADDEINSDTKTLVEETETEEVVVSESQDIDTSIFIYANEVEVTDNLDHIKVVIHMSEDFDKGKAVHHALNEIYFFLQQDRVKEVNTATFEVMSGDITITQLTVDISKFEPGEFIIEKMIDSVMNATKIDKMDDEVRGYGENLKFW